MLMMFKDIFRTLLFTLIPSAVFAFLIMEIIPDIKKSGLKRILKNFVINIKNNHANLFLFMFFMYVFIILYRTLFQRDFSYNPLDDVWGGWTIFKTQYTGLDYQVVGNVVMFLPFGLLYVLAFKKKQQSAWKSLLNATLVSLAFSAFIEINQLIFSKGTFQFSDIAYNTLGGLAGSAISLVIILIRNKKKND